ncbi:MAG: hypothetical protein IJY80_03365, partial [Opitutales bacterium]|nr:hypothetical protein [Opitutales bacterium]
MLRNTKTFPWGFLRGNVFVLSLNAESDTCRSRAGIFRFIRKVLHDRIGRMSADLNKTPMIQQYWEFRNKLPPNTLLFFRVGDFYEMFGADAERGAELLGVTLTKRSGLPLAGVPYHALQTYLQKALNAGVKIAICEQTEAAKPGKLVNRALV